MPVVRVRGGWLKIGRRKRPGEPDIGLPEGEGPVDPDYGLEEGGPEVEPPDPENPPPGIWPPPTPSHPIVPIPPEGGGTPGHLPALPPGAIWPRPPHPIEGKFVVLAHIPGHGWRYIVVDPDAWPDFGQPEHPIAPGGIPQPKR